MMTAMAEEPNEDESGTANGNAEDSARSQGDGTRAPNGESSVYFSEKDGYWHGWVTVGIKDNGRADRRHRMVRGGKTKAEQAKAEREIQRKVRDLEKERDSGKTRPAGPAWTVGKWLNYWITHIAPSTTGKNGNGLAAYEVAVRVHLVPGLGAHRLDKIRPEHFEKFYAKIMASDRSAATAHQVHRTARRAFAIAQKRGYISENVVALASPPRIDEVEVEPYTVHEVRAILTAASAARNSARWAIALALGFRQGEVLGMKWADVDLDVGSVRVRRGRLRPKYEHGCGGDCGRKAGYCKQKVPVRDETGDTKSKAGKRTVGLPDPLIVLLRAHHEEQQKERANAGNLWHEKGYVFTSEVGEPLNPSTDYDRWKALLKTAGIRDGRLHDARHTAATALLLLKIPDATVMKLMGWSSSSMAERYQHVTGEIRKDVAVQLGDLIWKPEGQEPTDPKAAVEDPPEDPNATGTATEDQSG